MPAMFDDDFERCARPVPRRAVAVVYLVRSFPSENEARRIVATRVRERLSPASDWLRVFARMLLHGDPAIETYPTAARRRPHSAGGAFASICSRPRQTGAGRQAEESDANHLPLPSRPLIRLRIFSFLFGFRVHSLL